MDPVDTEQIQSEIDRLVSEKTRIDEEISKIESEKKVLPSLEQERVELQERIATHEERLAEKREELDSLDGDVTKSRQEETELDQLLQELSKQKSNLKNITFEIETRKESIEVLTNEREELLSEAQKMPDEPDHEIEHILTELDRLQETQQSLKSDINQLQNIIKFNKKMLEGSGGELAQRVSNGESVSDRNPTEQLNKDHVQCWTCGTEVQSEQISSTLDFLIELRTQKTTQTKEIREKINKLNKDRVSIEKFEQRREEIKQQLSRNEREYNRLTEELPELEESFEELQGTIETLESKVENLRSNENEAILDLYREINQIEFSITSFEDDKEKVERKINDIENKINELEQLQAQRDELDGELQRIRTHIDRIEHNVIEEFNSHIENVLSILNYDNIERIWIERSQKGVWDGRKNVSKSVFDLHVIRKTQSGATYEDSIYHLSESERDVTSLIFALAGYLVHEVHEKLPFILLDSVEGIDSTRLVQLIEYISEFADCLVVALLPEDAQAFDSAYPRIREI